MALEPDGASRVPEPFTELDDDVDDEDRWFAFAVWSPLAIRPASAPATATLTPAAATRPCMLSFLRATGRCSHREVRIR